MLGNNALTVLHFEVLSFYLVLFYPTIPPISLEQCKCIYFSPAYSLQQFSERGWGWVIGSVIYWASWMSGHLNTLLPDSSSTLMITSYWLVGSLYSIGVLSTLQLFLHVLRKQVFTLNASPECLAASFNSLCPYEQTRFPFYGYSWHDANLCFPLL